MLQCSVRKMNGYVSDCLVSQHFVSQYPTAHLGITVWLCGYTQLVGIIIQNPLSFHLVLLSSVLQDHHSYTGGVADTRRTFDWW